LKSSQTAPVFFVGKKDRKKRIFQNYHYLNKWTIKDNYPLLLISDIIEKIGTKKVFTKLDLHWSYNNIQIKEEDKWKVMFTTPEGLFELTVIFFQLMNSLAMFQTIMNKILNNLINTGKVVSFINNIIIGMEEEENHNEIVEEVVKRLADEIKMKEEKVKL